MYMWYDVVQKQKKKHTQPETDKGWNKGEFTHPLTLIDSWYD